MNKKESIQRAIEVMGFTVAFKTQKRNGKTEKYAEFSGFTRRDRELEFVEFYERLDDLPEKLADRYNDFDVEEEVKLYLEAKANGLAGVPDTVDLVDDVKEEEAILWDLSEAVRLGLAGKVPQAQKSWMEKEADFEKLLEEAKDDPTNPLTEEAVAAFDKVCNEAFGHGLRWFIRQAK